MRKSHLIEVHRKSKKFENLKNYPEGDFARHHPIYTTDLQHLEQWGGGGGGGGGGGSTHNIDLEG